jgi:hypothetical protein
LALAIVFLTGEPAILPSQSGTAAWAMQAQRSAPKAEAPAPDEVEALVALLRSQYEKTLQEDLPLVITDRTELGMLPLGTTFEAFRKDLLAEARGKVPIDLIEDFCAKNKAEGQIWPALGKQLKIRLLSRKEERSIFAEGADARRNGWKRFYERFPGSPGIITVSRVGFNRDRTMAMVYVGWQSDYLAGHGQLYVLKKQDGKWIDAKISIGPSWES